MKFRIMKQTFSFGERFYIQSLNEEKNRWERSFTAGSYNTIEEAREGKKLLEQLYELPSAEMVVE